MSLSACDVIVLAAGAGKRMGGPKALMDVGGRMWARVQSERLARVGVRVVWVMSPEVREGLAAGAGGLGEFERVVLCESSRPMFESVVAGLREFVRDGAASAGGVFVLPVDVPAAGCCVWERLAACGAGVAAPVVERRRGGVEENAARRFEGVLPGANSPPGPLPQGGGVGGYVRGHPLFLSQAWAGQIAEAKPSDAWVRERCPDGLLRLDRLIEPELRLVEVDDPDVAVNLNTRDDVESWLRGSR